MASYWLVVYYPLLCLLLVLLALLLGAMGPFSRVESPGTVKFPVLGLVRVLRVAHLAKLVLLVLPRGPRPSFPGLCISYVL